MIQQSFIVGSHCFHVDHLGQPGILRFEGFFETEQLARFHVALLRQLGADPPQRRRIGPFRIGQQFAEQLLASILNLLAPGGFAVGQCPLECLQSFKRHFGMV